MSKTKLVLLPGLDGTGELFAEFVKAVPQSLETEIIRYPRDKKLSYAQLLSFIQSSVSLQEEVVLVAESFSTPLAVLYAAKNQTSVKAVILCAGFVESPLPKWMSRTVLTVAPVLFRLPLLNSIAELFLTGSKDSKLNANVRAAISTVRPAVLVDRLRSVLECDVRDEVRMITAPLLYLQASEDWLVGPHCVEEIKSRVLRLQVQVVDGPHLLLQSKAPEAAGVIVKFIEAL